MAKQVVLLSGSLYDSIGVDHGSPIQEKRMDIATVVRANEEAG